MNVIPRTISVNNLAEVYRVQGRYPEAEPLHKRSQAIREKALGPEHPHVATSLNNLAEVYRVQGRYAEAEPLYKRSQAIREKALGPEHPDVIMEKAQPLSMHDLPPHCRIKHECNLIFRRVANATRRLTPDSPDRSEIH